MQKTKSQILRANSWKNKEFLSAISLLGQLGLIMASSIVISVFSGFYLDRYFQTRGILMAICTMIGIFSGGIVCYHLLKKFFICKYKEKVEEG
jgi:F0F1-type ATP synthase assembly protein I